MNDTSASDNEDRIYIWLEHPPDVAEADLTIEDVPGVNDLDQLADAIRDGRLGRFLPVTLHFADHPRPSAKRVRAVDVVRLLRERHIRHRRRYEVIFGATEEEPTEA